MSDISVSYTHLDVYKRQVEDNEVNRDDSELKTINHSQGVEILGAALSFIRQ